MIKMSAEIEIFSKETSAEIKSISVNVPKNNISALIDNIINTQKDGSNPFIFGASILDNSARFSDGESYYIGSLPANAEKSFVTTEYPNGYEIVITCDDADINNFTHFNIIFDSYNNQFPPKIYIDNQEFTVESYSFIVANLTAQNTHTIYIKEWNVANYPLRIQGIYSALSIYCDRRNLISIDAPVSDRSDNEQPSYGIISNAGNLEFIDGTGEVKTLAQFGLLKSKLSVYIYLENTLSKKKNLIGQFITDKFSYDSMNFHVTVSFKDDLESLQESNMNKIPLQENSITLYNLFEIIKNTIISNIDFNFELTNNAKNILSNININYAYLDTGTYWSQINKIAVLAGLHIYEKNEKTIIIDSDFGD